MTTWLSIRFGRALDGDGLGRIPPMENLGSEDDFFAELIAIEPDRVVDLIAGAADFLRSKRTAQALGVSLDTGVLRRLSDGIRDFAGWYAACGIAESATAESVADLMRFRAVLEEALGAPVTGRALARLLLHEPPACVTAPSRASKHGETKEIGKLLQPMLALQSHAASSCAQPRKRSTIAAATLTRVSPPILPAPRSRGS
jgi:hypothetical protein